MVLPIILMDRGECTFAAKVRNAEAAGAAAALIVDTRLEDSENIVMADDGLGHTINIPSFMLRRDVGQAIKEYAVQADEESPVVVKISIDVHVSETEAMVDLWYENPFEVTAV